MYTRQRGITFIGWLILLVPLAIVVYAGIRLTPVYLNYMKVSRTLDETATELGGEGNVTPRMIRDSMQRHFDIDSVNFPTVKDIDVRRDGSGWTIEARYEDSAPLFGNIALDITFDKVARLQ